MLFTRRPGSSSSGGRESALFQKLRFPMCCFSARNPHVWPWEWAGRAGCEDGDPMECVGHTQDGLGSTKSTARISKTILNLPLNELTPPDPVSLGTIRYFLTAKPPFPSPARKVERNQRRPEIKSAQLRSPQRLRSASAAALGTCWHKKPRCHPLR